MFSQSPHLADDVGDRIAGFDPTTPLGVDPQSHVNVGEALLVRIVLRVFSQRLGKRERGDNKPKQNKALSTLCFFLSPVIQQL